MFMEILAKVLSSDAVTVSDDTSDQLSRPRIVTSKTVRRTVSTFAALGFIGGAVAVDATRAAADVSMAHHVSGTGGDGLWIHPNSTTIHSTISVWMPEGAAFDIHCWKFGDAVEGDSVWEYGTDAQGNSGYAADKYIDTVAATSQELTAQGIPQRGWTYSEKTPGWLQSEEDQQNMKAYLLHVRSENDLRLGN